MRMFLILLWVFLPLHALGEELKFATWNLNWLTTRVAGDQSLPRDVSPRSEEDFQKLADYARALDADVVAIEEVDGFEAASKVFSRESYSIHMTRDHVVQRVGLAVRRGLHYDINPDVTQLGTHHLRSGADITLHVGAETLRILAVHLKKGCVEGSMDRPRGQACEELRDQISPLTAWIAERVTDGVPFVILGDFNRWMDGTDAFLPALRQAAPLMRATEGQSSPCWGGERFIDHILAGGPAAQWMRPETLRVLVYRETDHAWRDRLSDHCPVSVRFAVP